MEWFLADKSLATSPPPATTNPWLVLLLLLLLLLLWFCRLMNCLLFFNSSDGWCYFAIRWSFGIRFRLLKPPHVFHGGFWNALFSLLWNYRELNWWHAKITWHAETASYPMMFPRPHQDYAHIWKRDRKKPTETAWFPEIASCKWLFRISSFFHTFLKLIAAMGGYVIACLTKGNISL